MEGHWLQIAACHLAEKQGRSTSEYHRHRDPQWYCCVEGTLRVSIDDQEVLVEAGDHIMIPPWKVRNISNRHRCTYLMLRFQSSCIAMIHWPQHAAHIPLKCSDAFKELLHQLSNPHGEKLSTLGETLFLCILLTIQNDLIQTTQQSISDQRAAEDIISKAEQFIDKHFAENIDRDTVAQTVHCSAVHFARLCKAQRNCTPHDLITKRRMEKAREFLAQTSLRIGAIAGLVGYASSSHFTQRFREIHGMTPLHFRRSGGRMWWNQKPQDGGPIAVSKE